MKTLLFLSMLCTTYCMDLNCTNDTKATLEERFKFVKFDDFFTKLQPLKWYGYGHELNHELGWNANCYIGEDSYTVRAYWTSEVGFLQFYYIYTNSCRSHSLWRGDDGYLKARYIRSDYLFGYHEDLQTNQRVYYKGYVNASFFTEFLLEEMNQSSPMVADAGRACEKVGTFWIEKPKVSGNSPRALEPAVGQKSLKNGGQRAHEKILVLCFVLAVIYAITDKNI